jgi:hypothetical protein
MDASKGEIVFYSEPGGKAMLEVRLEKDTVWLTQAQIAALFGRERSVITRHIRNIFASKELDQKSNVQKMHIGGSVLIGFWRTRGKNDADGLLDVPEDAGVDLRLVSLGRVIDYPDLIALPPKLRHHAGRTVSRTPS